MRQLRQLRQKMHGKLDKVGKVGDEVCQDGQLCHAFFYNAG